MSSQPLGIISDLDGTLYSNVTLEQSFHDAFTRFVSINLRLSDEAARTTIDSCRKTFVAAGCTPPSEFAVLVSLGLQPSDWLRYSEEVIHPEEYIVPDEALGKALHLIRTKVWFDVATNTARSLALRILRSLAVLDLVDQVWTPEIFEMGKPSLKLYLRIASEHNTHPTGILVLGDRWHIDLIGVKELGMVGRLVDGPENARAEMLSFALASNYEP